MAAVEVKIEYARITSFSETYRVIVNQKHLLLEK